MLFQPAMSTCARREPVEFSGNVSVSVRKVARVRTSHRGAGLHGSVVVSSCKSGVIGAFRHCFDGMLQVVNFLTKKQQHPIKGDVALRGTSV